MGPTVGTFAAKTILGVFKPIATTQPTLETAPHREKRSLAIYDLVSGALTHWILPEGLIRNNDKLANQNLPAFAPLSIQFIQASRKVVSTKDPIRHKRHMEVPTAFKKKII